MEVIVAEMKTAMNETMDTLRIGSPLLGSPAPGSSQDPAGGRRRASTSRKRFGRSSTDPVAASAMVEAASGARGRGRGRPRGRGGGGARGRGTRGQVEREEVESEEAETDESEDDRPVGQLGGSGVARGTGRRKRKGSEEAADGADGRPKRARRGRAG